VDFYLCILEKLSICIGVPNLKSVAVRVLEMSEGLPNFIGSRDPGHAPLQIFYLSILEKLSVCIPVPNF